MSYSENDMQRKKTDSIGFRVYDEPLMVDLFGWFDQRFLELIVKPRLSMRFLALSVSFVSLVSDVSVYKPLSI